MLACGPVRADCTTSFLNQENNGVKELANQLQAANFHVALCCFIQIAPPTEEHASIADLDSMTFDLTLMKSLEVLLMESIKIHRLEARHTLPKQLVKLEVRRSLKFLQVCMI